MSITLSASILSADFTCLEKEIIECEKASVDWIHIDVMDGHFVPNLTMGPFIVKAVSRITKLPLDCHLMIENPEKLISMFAKSGATIITIHPENNPKVKDTLHKIKELGCQAGLALNPETPLSILEDLLPLVDMLLIMSVHPGYSGQEFIPATISKIECAAAMIQNGNRKIRLEVDGGINQSTILKVVEAGADTIVSASAIFGYPTGISEGVAALRRALI